jgi:hypothetical protein
MLLLRTLVLSATVLTASMMLALPVLPQWQ